MQEGPVAHVDLGRITANLARVRARLAPGVRTMAMVKADAYGHGIREVSLRLAAEGVEWFGVATPGEARTLREAGVEQGVLLLSPAHDRRLVSELADLGVSVVATDLASVENYLASDLPRTLKVHLKVDTGMGRLGLPWQECGAVAEKIAAGAGLELEGVFTHLAASDEPALATTTTQLEAFEQALTELRRRRLSVRLRHVANSAAIVAFPDSHYDMVRPGIILYGSHSSDAIGALEPNVEPAMRLTAPVTFVKPVAVGASVSYGGLWHAPLATRVATVRMGYADGYRRLLTGVGWASVKGVKCNVVGRVCMDQMLIDVGEVPEVAPGDLVTLWGGDGPDVEALARSMGTVSYELLTGLSARVERSYTG